MIEKSWIKSFERDILALGSVVFYFLVIGRALIAPYILFVSQLAVAALILTIVFLFFKNFETYLARGVILIVCTGLFYRSFAYTSFSLAIFCLMIFSTLDLGSSRKKTLLGIFVGIFCLIPALLISHLIQAKFGYTE
jgi:hypothetical protein